MNVANWIQIVKNATSEDQDLAIVSAQMKECSLHTKQRVVHVHRILTGILAVCTTHNPLAPAMQHQTDFKKRCRA